MKIQKFDYQQEYDKLLALFGIVFSLFLFFFLVKYLLNSQRFIMFALTPILTIVSCIIWLLIRNKASLFINEGKAKSSNLILLYILVYLVNIFIYLTRPNLYERPLVHIILISFMSSIIFLQIIKLSDKYSNVILVEIIFLILNISWSQLFMYPNLVGFDPWVHKKFIFEIMSSHYIPQNFVYSKLPVFHVFIAETSFLTNLTYHHAVMASISFSIIVCSIFFTYLISKFLFNSVQIACLSALLLGIGNYFIYMVYCPIPNGFSIVFILVSFYAILKLKLKFLSMVFMGMVIITHTIAAAFMCILLYVFRLALSLTNSIYDKFHKNPYSFYYTFLFLVLMLSWWTYASGHIGKLTQMLITSFSIDNFNYNPTDINQSILTLYSPTVQNSEVFFNYIGMLLFFTLSFIGFFYAISKKYGNHMTFSYSIAAISPLAISFFSLILGRNILEHRWMYFSQVMLSVLFAVAIILIYNSIKNKKYATIGLFIFIFLLSFNLILTPSSSCDNHIFNPNTTYRYALMSSEFEAINTTMQKWNGTISVDNLYRAEQLESPRIDSYDRQLLYKNFTDINDHLLLVRNELQSKTIMIYTIISVLDYDLNQVLEQQNFTKMYDCGTVNGFIHL